MKNIFYTSVERAGNNILFRGYKDGLRVQTKYKFEPTLYVRSNKQTKFKSLAGDYLEPMEFISMYEAQQFIQQYKDIDNLTVYGQEDFTLQFIGKYFGCDQQFDSDIINTTTIDIEVYSDQGFPRAEEAMFPVTAITIKNNIDDIFYTWGTGDYDKKKSELNNIHIEYIKCDSERDLLSKFLEHWQKNYPDVITGWNVRFFDIPYLINRIERLFDEKAAARISPWKYVSKRDIQFVQKTLEVYEIKGIQQLDYLDLFKKFGYSYGQLESYKLDFVAQTVLGEKKLDYSEFGSLNDLYKNDFQKYIDYNIKDVQLVDRFEDKMGLINLCQTVAYKAGVNMSDAFGSVKVWDGLIFNKLFKEKIIIPPKKANFKEHKIQGAYVKSPINGFHKWVCSFDLNSLYPHLIMQYNMSPETLVNEMVPDVTVDKIVWQKEIDDTTKKYFDLGYTMTARGNLFRTDKRGILPTLVDDLYAQRSLIKKNMLKREQDLQDSKGKNEHEIYLIEKDINTFNNQQMAIKILMNSLYGAMSNEYFRYYSAHIAESITLSGQLSIRWAEKNINEYINKVLKTDRVDYIIAIDTDSLYVNLDKLVAKVVGENCDVDKGVAFLDKLCKEVLEPLLSEGYDQLAKSMNAYEQKMVMKREVIADAGVWTGKKHYALNVYDSEGVRYKEPKLKIMGIEAVRSSTPMACRRLISDSLSIILNKNEKALQDFIVEKRKWFDNLPVEDIAFPRGISNLSKYVDSARMYGKGTPIHCRAAILYNNLINTFDLGNKYERIYDGDKIKYVFLKKPNPINENVVGFSQTLPKEFDIQDYVDYNEQFEKAFIEPLNNILDVINWSAEKRNTLEDFFA